MQGRTNRNEVLIVGIAVWGSSTQGMLHREAALKEVAVTLMGLGAELQYVAYNEPN